MIKSLLTKRVYYVESDQGLSDKLSNAVGELFSTAVSNSSDVFYEYYYDTKYLTLYDNDIILKLVNYRDTKYFNIEMLKDSYSRLGFFKKLWYKIIHKKVDPRKIIRYKLDDLSECQEISKYMKEFKGTENYPFSVVKVEKDTFKVALDDKRTIVFSHETRQSDSNNGPVIDHFIVIEYNFDINIENELDDKLKDLILEVGYTKEISPINVGQYTPIEVSVN